MKKEQNLFFIFLCQKLTIESTINRVHATNQNDDYGKSKYDRSKRKNTNLNTNQFYTLCLIILQIQMSLHY